MSSSETVALRRESDSTAVLTLTRPERRNAVNAQLADELAQAVATIETWGVLVATLDAQGPAFCAGVDLAELETGGAALDLVVETMVTAPIHWTAVVQGAARGGALAILAACPRVLCGASATFGLPELSKGLFPADLIAGQVAAMGRRAAFDLAFSAAPVDAAEAWRIGIVSRIVPDDELATSAVEAAAAMATADRDAVRVGVAAWQSSVGGTSSSR